MQPCRSFKTDDKGENEAESELKLKKASGFWSSLKDVIFRVNGPGSQSSDEYCKAVAKVEKVFSSVSSLFVN